MTWATFLKAPGNGKNVSLPQGLEMKLTKSETHGVMTAPEWPMVEHVPTAVVLTDVGKSSEV